MSKKSFTVLCIIVVLILIGSYIVYVYQPISKSIVKHSPGVVPAQASIPKQEVVIEQHIHIEKLVIEGPTFLTIENLQGDQVVVGEKNTISQNNTDGKI